ncbi:hypothetical protein ISN45_Aa05g013830 [Arabidopsis thaliana x Arabidopsis arenosa]|uniref:At3g05675-like ankyrin-like domain-containing protein n=1 Tax=Arabidopsis thaliana x Arabidopsis arenosa TaxID=1240361 RepID=A0A8T1ZKE0_9BRAS|nr:hypothetical protein ISN45_Aa05g013830 [Arabidopsis thaliana x Arabidopsis arenosa]
MMCLNISFTVYVTSVFSLLILCLSEVTSHMNDPGDLIGEISREASNLIWIVDILIEKKLCDEFVKLWADQKELANLYSKIPAMYRHEISLQKSVFELVKERSW